MKKEDIRQLIGEATEYEKKQALEVKKPKSWCKSVSAFANGIGGRLVWGIADDDTLVGLADAKGDAEKISELIKTHLDPIPEFHLSFAKAEEKEFVVLTVISGSQTPYYYIGDGQMQAFVRVGNESVVASMSKHKELVLKGSNMSYDSLVSRWKYEDMAFTVLRATYFKRTNRSFDNSDYESFGIVNEKGKLTNAGALLADIFSRLKYMERRGSGFKKIVSAYKGHDGYSEGTDPTFSTPWNSFVLTLPKFNVDGVEGVYVSNCDDTEDSNEQGGQKGGQKEDMKTIDTILQLIKSNPSITRKVLAQTLGISQSAIQKHINRLKADKTIIRHGGDRGGYWEELMHQ